MASTIYKYTLSLSVWVPAQVQDEVDGGGVLEEGVQAHDGGVVQHDVRPRLAARLPMSLVLYSAFFVMHCHTLNNIVE